MYDSTSYTNSASCVGIIPEALLIVPNLHGNLEKLMCSLSVGKRGRVEWKIPNMYSVQPSESEDRLLLHMLLGKIAC